MKLEMLEQFRLPNGKRAAVARRNARYFVLVGPRTRVTIHGPMDAHFDALNRISQMIEAGRLLS